MSAKVIQYQGPFEPGYKIEIPGDKCKIGISIGEKDFMNPSSIQGPEDIRFKITINEHEQEIWIGRTYIYQMEEPLERVDIQFLSEAPNSTLIEVIYE